MSECRGYPNPDYMEETKLEEQITMHTEIVVDDQEYRELIKKAAMMDILTKYYTNKGELDADIVWALTGADVNPMIKELKKENQNVWDYYHSQKKRADDLEFQVDKLKSNVAALERAKTELTEILRQNHIGLFAEENQEEQNG